MTEFRELEINVFHHPTGSRRQKSDYDTADYAAALLPHLAAARLTRKNHCVPNDVSGILWMDRCCCDGAFCSAS